jgi:metal-dependent amidase/aminoacylase/carboxypeptidase family protein
MDAKDAAREKIEQIRKPLVDLSHRIHAYPELGFKEEKACG